MRWIALHLVEETARHAGHADIIREALDGGLSGALMARPRAGRPTVGSSHGDQTEMRRVGSRRNCYLSALEH